jgi:hypothetical protein
MAHPLGYYVSGPAITDLADQYGDRLLNMTVRDKFLALAILADTLESHESFPGIPVSIQTQINQRLDLGAEIDEALVTHLVALDPGNRAQIIGLIQAIASYLE